jgi:hypothetical protein
VLPSPFQVCSGACACRLRDTARARVGSVSSLCGVRRCVTAVDGVLTVDVVICFWQKRGWVGTGGRDEGAPSGGGVARRRR